LSRLVVEERVVDDGDLVTAGGVTSGIDMALWLVEREWSPDLANTIARDGARAERPGPRPRKSIPPRVALRGSATVTQVTRP